MVIALGLVLTAVVVWSGRRVRRSRAGGRHRRAVEVALAPTIDLVAVILGSGGTVRSAVVAVARHGPRPVVPAFESAVARADSGLLLADALAGVSDELGPAFRPLVGALVATERDGAPVSVLLQRLADDADQARRLQADAMAKRLPVLLLPPLVVCQLPAVIVGALVPLVVLSLRQLDL